MKKQKLFIVIMLLLAAAFSLSACGENVKTQAAKLESVTLISTPLKDTYFIGDTAIDLAGGVLRLEYDDNSEIDMSMTDKAVSVSYDFSSAGSTKVTVSYKDFGSSFDVTVETPEVAGIEIDKLPSLLEYEESSTINLSGGYVMLNYNNGTQVRLPMSGKELTVEYDFSEIGEAEVTIKYGEHSKSFVVSIIPGYDWDYLDMLCRAGVNAASNSVYLGKDTDLLSIWHKLYAEVTAMIDKQDTKWYQKFSEEFSESYRTIEFYYHQNAYTESFDADEEMNAFLHLYSDIYFQHYMLEGYEDPADFNSDIVRLIDMFLLLDEGKISDFFYCIFDSVDVYLNLTKKYYESFLDEKELSVYSYLINAKIFYDHYVDSEDTDIYSRFLELAEYFIFGHQRLNNTKVFDNYFADLYTEYKGHYDQHFSSEPEGYDWNNLRYIFQQMYRYMSSDDILFFYFYDLATTELNYFNANMMEHIDWFLNFANTYSSAYSAGQQYANEMINATAPDVFADSEALDFIKALCNATYLYAHEDCSGFALMELMDEVKGLYSALTGKHKFQILESFNSFKYYWCELNGFSYYPALITMEEANIYYVLFGADAFYYAWDYAKDDEELTLQADHYYAEFINYMNLAVSRYIELLPDSRARFDYFFSDMYEASLDLYHQFVPRMSPDLVRISNWMRDGKALLGTQKEMIYFKYFFLIKDTIAAIYAGENADEIAEYELILKDTYGDWLDETYYSRQNKTDPAFDEAEAQEFLRHYSIMLDKFLDISYWSTNDWYEGWQGDAETLLDLYDNLSYEHIALMFFKYKAQNYLTGILEYYLGLKFDTTEEIGYYFTVFMAEVWFSNYKANDIIGHLGKESFMSSMSYAVRQYDLFSEEGREIFDEMIGEKYQRFLEIYLEWLEEDEQVA